MAARYKTEVAVYSHPSTRDGTGTGADDDRGGGGGGGGIASSSRASMSTSGARSRVAVTGGGGFEHRAQHESHDNSWEASSPNSHRRSNTAFVSGPGETLPTNGWNKDHGIRTSSSNLVKDSEPVSTQHLQLQDSLPEREHRLNGESSGSEGSLRKGHHSSSRSARSSALSLPLRSSRSSLSSPSSSVSSSASSFSPPQGPPSAPSIESASSTVKSSPSKSSYKSASLPSSLPSLPSAFSTSLSSALSSSSSSNRQNTKKEINILNNNNINKLKSKHRMLYNLYKHQKQRGQGRLYDWGFHSPLVSLNQKLGVQPGSLNRSNIQAPEARAYKYHHNHHDKPDSKQSNIIGNNNNSNVNSNINSNNNSINHNPHIHSSQYSLMQRDDPFPEEDEEEEVSPMDAHEHAASARYARQSNSSPRENCAAPNGSRSCYCLKDSNSTLDAQMADLVCTGLHSPDCLSVAQHTHLKFCRDYDMTSLSSFLPFHSARVRSKEEVSECRDAYKDALARDRQAEGYYKGFLDLISRYDCTQSYSVKWNCSHCKVGPESVKK
ncbi:hypothetical protein EGW08_015400 [Elysia chlorotica]|uniref:Uncharacterized protein n=1 Tax=Elysia chlorotica TaxID=188477 RepID=A0A3S0ZG50_ELYCH|nr:hypothetical protein EGW08_015400 [Elysia chlorotica]